MPELVAVSFDPFKRSSFDAALDAEGIKGPIADIARSIYQQESGSGKNTKTSNAGAVGGMQIIPSTFKSVADPDWSINDPTQNARAGVRYIKQLYEQAGGDPALTAAGYYGGPGGLEKARRGVAVADPRNPNAPTTLQYGQQVAARIPKSGFSLMGTAQAGTLPADLGRETAPLAVDAPTGYGKRADGTQKGDGFFGALKRPDGNVSTELSVGVNINGKEVEIPTLIPTLTAAELQQLLALPDGQMPPEAIIRKAADFAKQRIAQGKSPFAQPEETQKEAQLVPVDFDPFAKKAEPESKGIKGAIDDGLKSAINFQNNAVAGAVRGAGSIGATLLAPYDMASDALAGKGLSLESNRQRRADMDSALQNLGADTNSLAFGAGKLGGEIAGTAGVGSALGVGAKALGAAPKVINALQSGGMTLGAGPAAPLMTARGAGELALRSGAGTAVGAASAGLVNPEDARTGALIGGALPVGTKVAGTVGNALGRAIAGKGLSPEVVALADRAKQLGIDIPADRLTNSKPLNALAVALDYVPGSGRAATMNKMEDQLNTALSKTFGQNSPNVTQALRKAGDDLGTKFETVLQNNKVRLDPQFATDLADAGQMASKELGSDGAKIISNQIDEILAKAQQTGDIDGQAAYNIKKTLDRIGKRNSPEAHYALDLKGKLMEALNRSLGPTEAAAFQTVRQQYGNMLSLEKLAQNGAEGGVSIARLANLKNINNPELQELADISAQFLKSREGAHGAAQRVGAGALTLGMTGPAGLAGGVVGGRAANMLLNSSAVKNRVLGKAPANLLSGGSDLSQLGYRVAPVLPADR